MSLARPFIIYDAIATILHKFCPAESVGMKPSWPRARRSYSCTSSFVNSLSTLEKTVSKWRQVASDTSSSASGISSFFWGRGLASRFLSFLILWLLLARLSY